MQADVLINGEITSDARISIRDRGYLLGDGIFETIEINDSVPFRLDKHLDRLKFSADVIRLKIPFDFADVRGWIDQLLLANNVSSRAVARITLTRDESHFGYSSIGSKGTNFSIVIRELATDTLARFENGIKVSFAEYRRDNRFRVNIIKSTSGLDRIVATDNARLKGADEPLFLTTDNKVSGFASGNIFWIKNGELFTPSRECAILPGVTRFAVMQAANYLGIRASYKEEDCDILKSADEVFMTNSLVRILPVKRIIDLDKEYLQWNLTRELLGKLNEIIETESG